MEQAADVMQFKLLEMVKHIPICRQLGMHNKQPHAESSHLILKAPKLHWKVQEMIPSRESFLYERKLSHINREN